MKHTLIIMLVGIFFCSCKDEPLEEQWKQCCQTDNISKVNDSTFIMLPTVFSPNGDGVNDQLLVYSSRVWEFHLTIYNINDKWVYQSSGVSFGWAGTHEGAPAPQGRYTFEVTWKAADGQQLSFNGTVCLLRDCLPPNTNTNINDCEFGNQFDPTIPGFDTSLPSGEANYPVCN